MGIQGLGPFLKKFASKAIRDVTIEDYRGTKVAFDVSIFVNTFYYRVGTQNPTHTVREFKKLVDSALVKDVYPIFVMEGKKLKLKANEHKKRKVDRDRKEELLSMCKIKKIELEKKADVLGYTLEHQHRLASGMIIPTTVAKKVINADEHQFRKQYVETCEEYDKRKQTVGKPGEDHFRAVLAFLQTQKVGIEFAEDEAERHCAILCREGKADAVATQDYDAIPFGAERVVMNWDTFGMKEIRLSVILEEWGWTMAQFIDFCILCGCDFSAKVPKIGVKTAYTLICEHKCIENMLNRLKINFIRYPGSEEAFRYQLSRLVFNHRVAEAENAVNNMDNTSQTLTIQDEIGTSS